MSALANPLSQVEIAGRSVSRSVEAAHLQDEVVINQHLCDLQLWKKILVARYLSAVTQQLSQPQLRQIEATQTVARPAVPAVAQSVEMEWLTTNSAFLAQYSGQWLLIVGNQLIEHSTDFEVIRLAVVNRGVASPFVYYVPTAEESNFISL